MRSGDYNLETDHSGKRRLQMLSMQAALAWLLSPSGFECVCHISCRIFSKPLALACNFSWYFKVPPMVFLQCLVENQKEITIVSATRFASAWTDCAELRAFVVRWEFKPAVSWCLPS